MEDANWEEQLSCRSPAQGGQFIRPGRYLERAYATVMLLDVPRFLGIFIAAEKTMTGRHRMQPTPGWMCFCRIWDGLVLIQQII
ncbi:MAG TPA: hypothetical protein VFU68_00915 [Terracidiphilus sp.]|nr:hypothetical protein [Terracidiphilus sp.]